MYFQHITMLHMLIYIFYIISKLLTDHVFHLFAIFTKLHFITNEARNNKSNPHSSGTIMSFSWFSIHLHVMSDIIAYSVPNVWR